jgi:hypothetical protein
MYFILIFLLVLSSSSHFSYGAQESHKPSMSKTNTLDQKLNIVIIADLFNDEDALVRYEIPEISKSRPGKWKLVRVKTEQDIQQAISTNENEVIQTILVFGLHTGYEGDILMASTRYWNPSINKMVYASIDFWRAFKINTNSAKAPKFTKDVLIAFESCNLVPDKNTRDFFGKMASALNVDSGWLYANTTSGISHPGQILGIPFYQGNQGWFTKFVRFVGQAAWPISLVFIYSSYNLLNDGFVAHVQDGQINKLDHFSFREVIEGKPPVMN